jgi:hypothetical protein
MECGEKVKPRKNWRRRRKPWVKKKIKDMNRGHAKWTLRDD